MAICSFLSMITKKEKRKDSIFYSLLKDNFFPFQQQPKQN